MAGALLFAAAGCDSGDSGDEDAFCDTLESLSDDISEGGLGSARGLEDAVDRANDLSETAGGDQEDAVQEAGETLETADPDDQEDTAEEIQDALGDIAEDTCEIDDFAVVEVDVDDTTTTSIDPDETTTTTDPDDTTTTSEDGGGSGELNIVGAAVDPASAGVEPGFEENIDLCFRGLMVACDDIFFGENGQTAAPEGSAARAYASSCGGRIEFNNDTQRCDDNLFGASAFDAAVFTDPSFEPLAQGCFDGDMASCDTLFQQTGIGTPEEAYGDTCGLRIDPDVADRDTGVTCVAIFGATAEFG